MRRQSAVQRANNVNKVKSGQSMAVGWRTYLRSQSRKRSHNDAMALLPGAIAPISLIWLKKECARRAVRVWAEPCDFPAAIDPSPFLQALIGSDTKLFAG